MNYYFIILSLLFFSCGVLKKTAKTAVVQKDIAVEKKAIIVQKKAEKKAEKVIEKLEEAEKKEGETTQTIVYFAAPVTLAEIAEKTAPVAKMETKVTQLRTEKKRQKAAIKHTDTERVDTLSMASALQKQEKETNQVIEMSYTKRSGAGWRIACGLGIIVFVIGFYIYKKYKKFVI